MLTMDEQKNQNADIHNCSIDGVMNDQNTNLDDVLLGRRVRIARKEKRLTQEELAGLCNCTPTHICNIENGKIGIYLELLFKNSILIHFLVRYGGGERGIEAWMTTAIDLKSPLEYYFIITGEICED